MEQHNEKSLKEIVLVIFKYVRFLLKKWYIVLLCLVLGLSIAYLYHKQSDKYYVGKVVFALEHQGQASGGFMPFNMGDEQQKGLFEGQNLKWLYQSKVMLAEILLQKSEENDSLFLDRMIASDPELQEKMLNFKQVRFDNLDLEQLDIFNTQFSREQNIVLNIVIGAIKSRFLEVENVKEADGLISIEFKSFNEKLAKEFVVRLVDNVNKFYVDSKTLKIKKQIEILEGRVNEYNQDLNSAIVSTAVSLDAIPFPNPAMQRKSGVKPKRKQVDVQLTSKLYTQAVASLKGLQSELIKETPLIQILEEPTYPLGLDKLSFLKAMLIGGLLGLFLGIAPLVLYKAYREVMQ